jgi:uncharacterized membrane protein
LTVRWTDDPTTIDTVLIGALSEVVFVVVVLALCTYVAVLLADDAV